MRAEVLAHAMGNALPDTRYAELAPAFSAAMAAAGCTTVARAAMWCAQLGHESGGLRWMEELADGSAYEGRADLGNVRPGDGCRFKGRGPIQVTGRANYESCSRWAHARGFAPTPTYFVDNPDALAHSFVGAVWYWTAARPQLNALADAGDIAGATRAINGGTNGLEARRARWDRSRAIGDALLESTPESTLTPEDDVPWTANEGAPAVPDLYELDIHGQPLRRPLPDPLWALANATAHAANGRDAAIAARDYSRDNARAIAVLAEGVRALNDTVNGMARLLAVTTPIAPFDAPVPAPAEAIHYPTLVGEMLAQLGLTPHQAATEGTTTE